MIMWVFLAIFTILNIRAYWLMWRDKQAAKRGAWRISEAQLLGTAALGGAVGIYAGMCAPLFHKAAKPKFRVGVPLLLLVQAGLLVLFFVHLLH
jgi:uncharacterized membrane protein YsdA (DUF1294 family)